MNGLGIALAGLGAMLAGWAMFNLTKRLIHARVAADVVSRVLHGGGDLQRVVKLCAAAGPQTILEAVKQAVMKGTAFAGRDRITVDAEIGPVYDAAAKQFATDIRKQAELGLFGAALIGGSFLVAMSDNALGTFHYACAAAAGAFTLYFAPKRGRGTADAALVRDRVLPQLATVLAANAKPLPAMSTAKAAAMVLKITRDGTLVRSETFDRDIIKIGRAVASHVVLDSDQVARMHAVIENTPEGATIIDVGSTTGTKVNGTKVNKAPLALGDAIEIGPFRLEVG